MGFVFLLFAKEIILFKQNRFKVNQTKTTGSSAQYQEFEGNLSKADSWVKVFDCDFLISIELEEWPSTAKSWISLPRNWPTPEVF